MFSLDPVCTAIIYTPSAPPPLSDKPSSQSENPNDLRNGENVGSPLIVLSGVMELLSWTQVSHGSCDPANLFAMDVFLPPAAVVCSLPVVRKHPFYLQMGRGAFGAMSNHATGSCREK